MRKKLYGKVFHTRGKPLRLYGKPFRTNGKPFHKVFSSSLLFSVRNHEFLELTNYKKYWYPLKGWRPERPQAGGEVQSTEPLLSTQPTTEPRSGWQSYLPVYPSYRRHSVTLRHTSGVPLRFTTCLCSVVLSGLAKPCMNEKKHHSFFITAIEWLHFLF